VDRPLTPVSRANLLHDGVGIGGPGEGFGIVIGFGELSIDSRLEIDDAFEDTVLEPLPGQFGRKKPSTALSQEADVGCSESGTACASQARTLIDLHLR